MKGNSVIRFTGVPSFIILLITNPQSNKNRMVIQTSLKMTLPFISKLFSYRTACAFVGNLFEKIVAFVVHKDECGEILNFNFPNSLHAEFGIFKQFHFLDGVLGEDGCRTTD